MEPVRRRHPAGLTATAAMLTAMLTTMLTAMLTAMLTLALPGARAANKLPADYPLCRRSGPQLDSCLQAAAQRALVLMKEGIPQLGVPPIDPLHVDYIEIGQGSGPIAISQKFRNVSVAGLSSARLLAARSDLDNFLLTFDGEVSTVFEADYVLDGRILLLPVTGKGRCRLVFTNMKATISPEGKGTNKKSHTYFDVTGFKLTIGGLDKMQVRFDNLFNGDRTLGETMNNLLNENWRDLWGELKPAFEETFGAVFRQYSKRIFDKVPFHDIFLA